MFSRQRDEPLCLGTQKMKKIFIAFTLILGFVINASAGLIVTPARSEIVIENENSFEGEYIVENGFDATVDISVTTKNWNNSKDNKDVGISDWLVVKQKNLTLKPNESAVINYSIKSGQLKGSLSGMISFTLRMPGSESINLMTSVPVYMIIDGTQKVSYGFDKITLANDKNSKNIIVAYTVKNDGNVYVRLGGKITVLSKKKVVYEQVIPQQSPVYPDLNRSFIENVPRLPKGKYVLNISLSAYDKTAEKSIQFRVNKYGDVSF